MRIKQGHLKSLTEFILQLKTILMKVNMNKKKYYSSQNSTECIIWSNSQKKNFKIAVDTNKRKTHRKSREYGMEKNHNMMKYMKVGKGE